MLRHEVRLEKHGSMRLHLAELAPEFRFAERSCNPCFIEAFKSVSMKPALRFIQEFEIFSDGHNVLAFFESLADLEIPKDFTRHIRLKRLLHDGAEALRCPRKLRVRRGDIKEAKSLKLAKERLVGCEMCQKTGHTSEAGIDVGQRDHRGSTEERCCCKQRKLIHEIAKGRTASRPAFIDLAWKELLRDAQFFAEKGDFVLLGFKILGFRISEDEIKQDQAGANVFY